MAISKKRFKNMRSIREFFNKLFPKDPEKTYAFLRGFCSDKNNPKPQTLKALKLAQEQHAGKFRENGEPYIVHPFQMACMAIAMGLTDDRLLAIIIVHDVFEDTDKKIEESGLNIEVQKGAKLITFESDLGETKLHYFLSLKENPYALIAKALDRIHNLATMPGVLPEERCIHNLRETLIYLLPSLKEARDRYPEFSNEFYLLRYWLKTLVFVIAICLEVSPLELGLLEEE